MGGIRYCWVVGSSGRWWTAGSEVGGRSRKWEVNRVVEDVVVVKGTDRWQVVLESVGGVIHVG